MIGYTIISIILLINFVLLIYSWWTFKENVKKLNENIKKIEYKTKCLANQYYAKSIYTKDVKQVDERCTNLWTRINQIVLYNRLKEKL